MPQKQKKQKMSRSGWLPAVVLLVVLPAAARCDAGRAPDRVQPEYDPTTGRLALLKYDASGDGRIDTWSYLDGTRVIRIEMDRDGDGQVDRWEYYDAGQTLTKIGLSRARDGRQDAWAYPNPDGSIRRVDVSTHRDGNVDRVEFYEREEGRDVPVRVEQDGNGDGRPDKWETYDEGRLVSVAFDTRHRGTPDRRVVYAPGGAARLEVDEQGTGSFVGVEAGARGR